MPVETAAGCISSIPIRGAGTRFFCLSWHVRSGQDAQFHDHRRRRPRPRDALESPDKKTATDDAQIAIAEMARNKLPNGMRAVLAVKVADESGKAIYAAEMHFATNTEEDIAREDEEAEAAADNVASTLAGGGRRE